MPQGVTFKVANDTTRYTRDALHDVQFDLSLAVLITGLVLLLFLHSWRSTVIVLLAIPTSLIATFVRDVLQGFTLNFLTTLALTLTIGILVDDSIVVLENIYRHLARGETPCAWRRSTGGPRSASPRSPSPWWTWWSTSPWPSCPGNIGQFFRQFGLTVAAATLFSLLVSFTLTPLLASRWLKAHGEGGGDEAKVAGVPGALIADRRRACWSGCTSSPRRWRGRRCPSPAGSRPPSALDHRRPHRRARDRRRRPAAPAAGAVQLPLAGLAALGAGPAAGPPGLVAPGAARSAW